MSAERRHGQRRLNDGKRHGLILLFTVIGATGILLLAVVAVVVASEKSWLRYPKLPAPTLDESYAPGEAVLLSIQRCNDSKIDQIYMRTADLVRVDKPQPNIVLPSGNVKIKPGCHSTTSDVNVLGKKTPPGRYFIDGLSKPDGQIRNFLVPWRSVEFDVVAPKVKP